jgi:pimeloyl-ACP methyl ester carboxylesterase
LLDELGVKKCVMLGHSMGGYVTLAFAKAYPEYLNGFGLLHSTTASDSEERKDKRKQVLRFIETQGMKAYLDSFIPGLFKDQDKHRDLITELIGEALKGPDEGIKEAIHAMMKRGDSTSFLSANSLPVFWAIGKHDPVLPEKDLLKLTSLCPEAHVCSLQQSAHMGMFEEADTLNTALEPFLSRAFAY